MDLSKKRKVKAKYITFEMTSHDQGWATFGGNGTYNNSHTWFEASILRPTLDPPNGGMNWDLKENYASTEDARDVIRNGWDFVEYNVGEEGRIQTVWKVHNNITAHETDKLYQVE
ncbi:hypothetical protein ACMFMG_008346 [Clarireedia jacksonii]